MAADTIQAYLEHGTIKNSVNFPAAALPERKEGSIRVTVATQNVPGMLAYISEVSPSTESTFSNKSILREEILLTM